MQVRHNLTQVVNEVIYDNIDKWLVHMKAAAFYYFQNQVVYMVKRYNIFQIPSCWTINHGVGYGGFVVIMSWYDLRYSHDVYEYMEMYDGLGE